MSLLDELKAKGAVQRDSQSRCELGWSDRQSQLDANAQDLYNKIAELHPGERIEVEHWTIMRVYDDNGLCIDVRRSIAP